MKNNKSKKFNFLFGGLFLLALLLSFWFWQNSPRLAEASWWNDSWLYRKALTINHAKVAGDLTDFPVLVSRTDVDFIGKAQEDGGDFVFTLQDGTVLKHEIESYASTTGALVAWVKMPALSSTADADIFIYYGNASVENQETPDEAWDDNFKGVWHMASSTFGIRFDSTSNSVDGTTKNFGGDEASTTSIIATGLELEKDGTEYVELVNGDNLTMSSALTISAWIRPESLSASNNIFTKLNSTTDWNYSLILGSDELAFTYYDNVFERGIQSTNADIAAGSWSYIVMTFSDSDNDVVMYKDGIALTDNNGDAEDNSMIPNNGQHVAIGNGYYGGYYDSNNFDGILDEVRISNQVRTAAWIQTEYNNQNDPASFFAVAAEEVGPGPVGYWSFDEGHGTTAHDESGQGNDGVITGAIWKEESECVSGKCLWFDGSDDYARTISSFNAKSKIVTVSMWLSWNNFADDDSLAMELSSNFNNNANAFLIDPNSGTAHGKFEVAIHGTNLGNTRAESFERLSADSWHFYSFILDNSSAAGNVTVYVDGSEASTASVADSKDVSGFFRDDFLYFMSRAGTSLFGSGKMDEVKIYPYARSADQIKQDYNAGLAGVKSNTGAAASFGGASDKWLTDGLVGYWKFDESATTSGAVDASGNGNTGAFYGNASTTAGRYGNGYIGDDVSTGTIGIASSDSLESIDYGFTISGWFKNYNVEIPGGESIINTYEGNNMGYFYINLDSTGKLLFNMGDSVQRNSAFSSNTYDDGEWHFFTAVRDVGNELRKLYVDGNFEGSSVDGGAEFVTIYDVLPWIGSNRNLNSFFDGQIDEVRIYNRALSPDEVRRLYEWAPGPVAHWNFDEMSGATAFDSVASSSFAGGNNGTISGAAWGRGEYGGGLSFDGDDNRVVAANSPKINFSKNQDFTISAWLKSPSSQDDTTVGVNSILEKWGGAGAYPYVLRIENQTSVNAHKYYVARYDGANNPNIISDNTYNDDQFHYVTFKKSGSVLSLYIDGILDDTATDTTSGDTTNSSSLYIGSRNLQYYYKGLIDDVRIYNYARTQKQILEDMNGGNETNGGSGALNAPVLHLGFDEGLGAVAHDASIYNNDGSLQPGTGGTNTSSSSMWTKNGKVGGAMEFDGADDYAEFTGDTAVDSASFSVSVWVKPDSVSDNAFFVNHTAVASPWSGWSIGMDRALMDCANGDICLWTSSNSGTNYEYIDYAYDFPINAWTNWIATYDENTEIVKFYINSKPVLSEAVTYPPVLTGTEVLVLGADNAKTGAFYDGFLDEVKIWNYALSEDEIKSVYNQNSSLMVNSGAGNNNGTAVTGASAEYCVPGDTARCDAPVLELKMDEMSGTTAYDSSGNGNNGVLGTTGGTDGPDWTRGKVGSALDFKTSSFNGDYVSVADPGAGSVFDITGAVTMEAWIYPRSAGDGSDWVPVISKDFRYWMGFNNSGNLSVYFNNGTGQGYQSAVPPELNKWQHLVGIINNETDRVKMYVDGILLFDQAETSDMTVDNLPVVIGDFGSDWPFDGMVDQVRIYNYERTPVQIAWDYNKGQPIAHWRFDECQGGTIHDESGNGNHGILNLGTAGVTATGTCASSSNSFWYNGREGKYNGSGSFDEVSDFVSVPAIDLSGTNAVSLSFWFKHNYENSNSTLFELTNNTNNYQDGFGFFPDDNDAAICRGYIMLMLEGNSGYNRACYVRPSTGEWHHMAAIYDKSQASQEVDLYIDGKYVQAVSRGNTMNNTNNFGNRPFYMMSRGGGNEFEGGQIDEVKIFNYRLTAEQVKNEYNGGAIRFGN